MFKAYSRSPPEAQEALSEAGSMPLPLVDAAGTWFLVSEFLMSLSEAGSVPLPLVDAAGTSAEAAEASPLLCTR
jgi:hypothetical protein